MQTEAGVTEACPRCEGRGWVVEGDGGAGTARPCSCRLADLGPRLLAAAGIPPRYAACTLANFSVDVPDAAERAQLGDARAVCERYVDRFVGEDGRFRESGLLFVGVPGVGKTHLATSVLAELIRRYRVHGLFVDFTALIHQIQSTFEPRSDESKREVLRPVTEADVLVLDDLGAQKPSAWVQEILYLIMNTRYARSLPTLFTTNYRLASVGRRDLDRGAGPEPELLTARISAALVSRLYEMARPVVIEASDFRREVKMHRHRL